MTKAWATLGSLLVAAAVLSASSASAHGAPAVRDIDTRILLDDDGPLGFGGCVEGTCVIPGGGLDLLALDVREARLPDGGPALVLRFVVQSDSELAGKSLTLALTAVGADKTFTLSSSDGLAWTSPDLDRVDAAVDIGDGHPKAIDAWLRYSTLGVKAGDVLTGISVGSAGTADEDVMPGGWFVEGLPFPADPTAEPAPASYTLKGPAALLTLQAKPVALSATGEVQLRISSPVGLPQFVDLALAVPTGSAARLAQSSVNLDPSGAREIALHVTNLTKDGVLRVVAVSDLGAYEALDLKLTAPAVAANTTPSPSGSASPFSSTSAPSKDTPLPMLALPAVIVALAVLVLRRPGGP